MRYAWLALVLVGCGHGVDHFFVSVGGGGTLSAAHTGCTHAPTSAVRFVTAERYLAIAPGTAALACADRDMVIDVREPARIAIDPAPTTPFGTRLVYSIRAYDAAGVELELGEDAVIAWSFGGAVTERGYPGCGDIIPICPPLNHGFALATGAGAGTIDATFHGLHAHATTTVAR